MIKTRYLLPFLFIGIVSISGCANLRGNMNTIQTLIELGKSEKDKEKILKQETMNFEKVKKYINSNKIEKGISKDIAVKKFGEPVLIFSEPEAERWAYKAADASWLSGEKIYLFFDKDAKLVKWECVN